MAQGPIIIHILIQSTFSDMSVHFSEHFWGVSGWLEAPTVLKNCDFSAFWHAPQCGNPRKGSWTHNYSYTHPKHILRHVCAQFRTFQMHFRLIRGSYRLQISHFFPISILSNLAPRRIPLPMISKIHLQFTFFNRSMEDLGHFRGMSGRFEGHITRQYCKFFGYRHSNVQRPQAPHTDNWIHEPRTTNFESLNRRFMPMNHFHRPWTPKCWFEFRGWWFIKPEPTM